MINGLILRRAIASSYPDEQGKCSYLHARVRVAQSRIELNLISEWIEETVSSSSARHSRASEGYPARSFVEAIFWQKLSRAVQEIGGLATPHFSEMEGGQPLRCSDFITEACENQNSRNPYFMQSFYNLKSPSNISK